ncbi:unnamed protein product [Mortierella alpina]
MSSPAPRGAAGPSGLPSSTPSPSPAAARDNVTAVTPQRANAPPGQTTNADEGPGPDLDDGEDQPCQSCGEFPAHSNAPLVRASGTARRSVRLPTGGSTIASVQR